MASNKMLDAINTLFYAFRLCVPSSATVRFEQLLLNYRFISFKYPFYIFNS